MTKGWVRIIFIAVPSNRLMKTLVRCLGLACVMVACDAAPPEPANEPLLAPPLSETMKQPLDDARGAEKQIFDSADRQKQQAEQI